MSYRLPCALILSSLLIGACAGSTPHPDDASNGKPPPDDSQPTSALRSPADQRGEPPPPLRVEVPLLARSGSHISGKATFAEVDGGVEVTVEVSGAPPGKIATHVHEKGDCGAPDAKSAGDHFNPLAKPHSLPPEMERHLGDLGNIEIQPDGTGRTELLVKGASLRAGDPASFLGRSIIVHGKQDDGGQPSGNAGDRIGCGVITPR